MRPGIGRPAPGAGRWAVLVLLLGALAAAAAAWQVQRLTALQARAFARAAAEERLGAWRGALEAALRLADGLLALPARIQESGRTVDPPRLRALAALARDLGAGIAGIGWAPRRDGGFPVRLYFSDGTASGVPGGDLAAVPQAGAVLARAGAAAGSALLVLSEGVVLGVRPAYGAALARREPLQREAGLIGFFFVRLDLEALLADVARAAARRGEWAWLSVAGGGPVRAPGTPAMAPPEGERILVEAFGVPWRLQVRLGQPLPSVSPRPALATLAAGLAAALALALGVHARLAHEARLAALVRVLGRARARLHREAQRRAEAEAVAGLGHWEWDPERRRLRLSRGARALLGLEGRAVSRAALVGRVAEGDRARVGAALEAAVGQGRPFALEHGLADGDGLRTVRHVAHARREAAGWRVVGVLLEVTGPRALEARVRALGRRCDLLARAAAVLAGEGDARALAGALCRELCGFGDYVLAVVDRLVGEGRLERVAPAGDAGVREAPRAVAAALREGRPLVRCDLGAEPELARWLGGDARGGCAVAVVPFDEGAGGGVLAVAAADPARVDAEELEALAVLAAGLGRRLRQARNEAARVDGMAEARRRAQALAQAPAGVLLVERKGAVARVTWANAALAALTGRAPGWALGRTPEEVLAGGAGAGAAAPLAGMFTAAGPREALVRGRRPEGGEYWACVASAPLDEDRGHVAVAVDVTGLMRRQKALEHGLLTDGETGLPGPALLADRLERLLAVVRRGGRGVGVLVLQLDGLAEAAPRLGEEGTRRLRAALAAELQGLLREADTVAADGDRFVVVVTDAVTAADARRAAERLRKALAAPRRLGGGEALALRPRIGLAVAPGHGDRAEALLRHAQAELARTPA
ncbi:diguanylate cyclase domain-containing protein [Inmirania thermothiophila]|uniref:Diguanylate cyclase (GGDEF)-like protein n=1 Tax=Inmirania thermothiophila TaxID=1750597 RepID=A0A3N1Y1M9_9GAMM|nr:diguanylate cyclase [Inmirania thermothiophila]ROR32719.1 diguanylate cyclase (GGDEF)-like protein [Inmirania thermothiophila]